MATGGSGGQARAGNGGLGGSGGGLGGGSGFSGAAGVTSAGSGGTMSVPMGWRCPTAAYRDGTCDCGCGVADVDCPDGEIESCEVCNQPGSCNGAPCPGRIYPNDPTDCTLAPLDWVCTARAFTDGTCHCGCGAVDADCQDDSIESCEVCNLPGSCSFGSCPGAIDATDNGICHVPGAWSCPEAYYGDDECDCGCGVPDVDCASSSVDVCERCFHGCSHSVCPGSIAPNDNRVCTGPSYDWRCQPRFYGDGSLCHCGCGAVDPDCTSPELELCEVCNVAGSCSAHPCPGIIDPENPTACDAPPEPEGWTCTEMWADGACDCGCGVVDIDCPDATPASCDTCHGCYSTLCPGSLVPGDTTACIPPPPAWHCDEHFWADGYTCDCGCGAVDLDCENASRSSCDQCPNESCSDPYCMDVRESDNSRCDDGLPEGWTCSRTVYGDQACDCGCGARDVDCSSTDRSACDFCNAPGSCSQTACPGTISATDNTTCQ